jgi:hypothetical protein
VMLLFCKKTTSCSFDPFFSFLCEKRSPFLFVKPKKEDLFFPPKKSKKVDDVALPQPSFRRERKKKKD